MCDIIERCHIPHKSLYREIRVHSGVLGHKSELFTETDTHFEDAFGLTAVRKEDLALVGFEIVSDYVHEGRFTRAVRSEKRVNVRLELRGEMLKRLVASVSLRYVIYSQFQNLSGIIKSFPWPKIQL